MNENIDEGLLVSKWNDISKMSQEEHFEIGEYYATRDPALRTMLVLKYGEEELTLIIKSLELLYDYTPNV